MARGLRPGSPTHRIWRTLHGATHDRGLWPHIGKVFGPSGPTLLFRAQARLLNLSSGSLPPLSNPRNDWIDQGGCLNCEPSVEPVEPLGGGRGEVGGSGTGGCAEGGLRLLSWNEQAVARVFKLKYIIALLLTLVCVLAAALTLWSSNPVRSNNSLANKAPRSGDVELPPSGPSLRVPDDNLRDRSPVALSRVLGDAATARSAERQRFEILVSTGELTRDEVGEAEYSALIDQLARDAIAVLPSQVVESWRAEQMGFESQDALAAFTAAALAKEGRLDSRFDELEKLSRRAADLYQSARLDAWDRGGFVDISPLGTTRANGAFAAEMNWDELPDSQYSSISFTQKGDRVFHLHFYSYIYPELDATLAQMNSIKTSFR